MLHGDFRERSRKRATAAEPFIDDDAQRVLVAGEACFAAQLFGRHVGHRTADIAALQRMRDDDRGAEVAEQGLLAAVDQDIFGLYIAVYQLVRVRVLQGPG